MPDDDIEIYGDEAFLRDVRESGNSVVVSIPKQVRNKLGIQTGDKVYVRMGKVPDRHRARLAAQTEYDHEAEGTLHLHDQKIADLDEIYYNKGKEFPIEHLQGDQMEKVGEQIRRKIEGVIVSGTITPDEELGYSREMIEDRIENRGRITVKIDDGEDTIEVEDVELSQPTQEELKSDDDTTVDRKHFRGSELVEEHGEV